MRKAKNISKPETDNRIIRLRDFEFINKFTRLKISTLSEKKVDDLVVDFIRHILLTDSIKPFSDFAIIHQKYEKLKSDHGYDKLRDYLGTLQQSIKEKVAEVVNGFISSTSKEVLSFNGCVRIIYNDKTETFDTKFLPKDFDFKKWEKAEYPDSKIDSELIKAQYFDIVSYLLRELPKGRFKLCDRCEAPFFQATVRDKLFCSSRCARTIAQAKYRKKKSKGGKSHD